MIGNKNEIIRYALAGILNTIAGYGVFIILVYLININPYYSNIIGYIFGLSVAFILNKYYVFNIKKTTKVDVIKFVLSFLFAYGINIFVLFLCLKVFNLSPALGQIFAMVMYTISFYVLNKFLVFNATGIIK